jgi:hypothetical protein
LWYSFQCDESLQGAQGNSNHFSVLGCTTHEYGLEKIVRLWSIYILKSNRFQKQVCTHTHKLHEPEAKFVVACSGEARKIAKDFSAAW